jgi:hypothetical protein
MFSISKPFDLTGVFSGPSVPLPYKYRLFSFPSPSRLDDTPCTSLPCQYTISPTTRSASIPPLHSSKPTTIQLCQLSSATQRASGSSTSTGACTHSVASGTQKEGVLIYGSAFVPVRSSVLTATPPAHSVPHTDQSTPGSQVSSHCDTCRTCFY